MAVLMNNTSWFTFSRKSSEEDNSIFILLSRIGYSVPSFEMAQVCKFHILHGFQINKNENEIIIKDIKNSSENVSPIRYMKENKPNFTLIIQF